MSGGRRGTHIVERSGAYYLERRAQLWAQVLAAFLVAPWIVLSFAALSDRRVTMFVVVTLVLGLPAVALISIWGSPKRVCVTRYVDGQRVGGGVLLRIVDAKGETHSVMADELIAVALAMSLTRARDTGGHQ